MFGDQMKRIKEQVVRLGDRVKQYKVIAGALSLVGLSIWLLRKYHYQLIVHPDVGGRHNNENPMGLRHPAQRKMECEDIQINTQKNIVLRGWYIKHPQPKQTILYFHQNAGNIGGRLFFIASFLKNSNSNFLLVSYRGFSDSDGKSKPNQAQIMKDASAILDKGIQLSKRDSLPLFVFGRSLGGAAAIHVLSQPQYRVQTKGVILQNTFTSIYDVASNFLHPALLPFKLILWMATSSSYTSIKKIKDIRVPILFIKGKKDTLVPSRLMDELEEECSKFRRQHFSLQVQNGTHNDTWYVAGQRYFTTINQFMAHCSRI